MLGTTYKVGFDAKAVRAGLAGMSGMLGRVARQISIGGARRIGEGGMDIFSRILSFAPMATKEMLDWASGMTDAATQTRMSVKDLMELEEAMRLAGASSGDASMMVSRFKRNLFLAATEAGPARDALNAIGFSARELDANDVVGSMQKVAKALEMTGLEAGQMEDIFAELFGARGGMKMIRVMTDMDKTLRQARRNLGGFQNDADDLFPVFDAISDTLGRWTMIRRQLMAGFVKGMFGKDAESADTLAANIMNLVQRLTGAMQGLGKLVGPIFEGITKVFDTYAKLGPVQFIQESFQALKNLIGKLLHGALEYAILAISNTAHAMAASIGTAIGSAIKSSLGFMGEAGSAIGNGMRRIGGALGIGGKSSPDKTTAALLNESKNQTALLDRIHRDGTTAVFA
jgi:hypothetical protein